MLSKKWNSALIDRTKVYTCWNGTADFKMRLMGAVLLGLCAAFVLWAAASSSAVGKQVPATGLVDPARGVLTVAPTIERAAPAVVNISVSQRVPGTDNPLFRDPYFRRFFGVPDERPQREALSAGSGVIVDAEKGYVLTNHHVVQNGERITVKLRDGRRLKAKLIGSDAATDIAVLQVSGGRLSALQFGASDQLRVGDFVVAIGNPFGLGQTVTSGIVSALGRSGLSRDKFENFIQTDASINPGNSGGALINTKGELIGINTAIIAPSGGNVGIGFAVPSNMAKAVMEQLVRHGTVKRGRIGVVIQDITPDIAQALDLPQEGGALISQIEKASPAEAAGLQAGDAVLKVDGVTIRNGNGLRNIVGLREIGSSLELTIVRQGQRNTVSVTIGQPKLEAIDGETAVSQLAGAKITDIPDSHPIKGDVVGVYLAEVRTGSPAWRLGLRRGDIVTEVNRNEVSNLSQFEREAKNAGDVLALNVLRDNTEMFIVVQ